MGWILPLTGIISLCLHLFLLHINQDFSWYISLSEGLLNSTFLVLGIWSIILFIKNYPTQVGALVYSSIMAGGLAVLITYISNLSLGYWFKADPHYLLWLEASLPAKYIITWITFSWVASLTVIKKKADGLEKKFVKHSDAAELLRDAELFKLRQQLQPHFLYNSLNSISALVMIQPDKAQEMVGKLSDFLRSSVKREAADQIPVAEELAFIEAYLSIEAVRFGDRLQVNINVGDTGKALIPHFLLQPLLENAIKFGLYGKTGYVSISVDIYVEDQMLNISISNPYDADNVSPKGTGFGIEGIRRRLELLYARTDLLEIKKDENTFTTTLKIPQANA